MDEPNERFTQLFEACGPRLYAYACRQVGRANAEDLVADTFVVALRRMDVVPVPTADALAWLVATARKLAANQRRRDRTQERYWVQAVRDFWHHDSTIAAEDAVAERERCLTALAGLSEGDRELLLLVAWEGLTAEEASRVLGISRNAFAVRLHRSRQRLSAALKVVPGSDPRPSTPEVKS